MVLRRGHVPGIVVGEGRGAVQRIGRREQPAEGVVGECGCGVDRIERIPRFRQQALRIVEEPRDLVIRIRNRQGIAFGIVGDRGRAFSGSLMRVT